MARHTIQIPITKSSCSPSQYRKPDWFTPNPVGNILYTQRFMQDGIIYYRSMAMGWVIPDDVKKKNIIDITLHLYSLKHYDVPMRYIYRSFNEGGSLPEVVGQDNGGDFGALALGWNAKRLENSHNQEIVIGCLTYQAYTSATVSEVYSHRNPSYKPYVTITYDDLVPDKPTSLYPSEGITASTRDIIRFAWKHNTKEDNLQKGFDLQYRLDNGSVWTTISQTTPNQFYDMPANTLPTTGTVTWRVRTTDGNGEVSVYETASFNLGILPQQAPVPIAPISQYVDRTKPVRLEWSFMGGNTGDKQSKFDLDCSTNGGASWTTITDTSASTHHELPANTFSNGNVTWRVRTYSNWNEVSPYSENKSFTVIGSPAIPLINNATNSARPVITWSTAEQHVYELQILQRNEVLYSSGSIPSTSDRSFKIPTYLQDGNYTVKLKILNEYNLSSSWSEKSFTISTVKPLSPDINIFSQEYSVTIKMSNTSNKTLIYRNDILIGLANNNTFTDYTGENKKYYNYYARAIDENDNFADSETKMARCRFSGNTIALANDPENFVKLFYGLDSMPKKTHNINNQGSLIYYDGRVYPVAEYSEFKSKSKTLSLVLENKKELDELIEMIETKEALLYRDADGENIYGVIFNLDYEKNILEYYQISFTVTKTDYKGVAYD